MADRPQSEAGAGGAADGGDAVPGVYRSARVVTRAVLTDLLRKQRDSPLLMAFLVGVNVFLAWTLVGLSGTGAYDFGVALAAGDGVRVVDRVRDAAMGGLVIMTVMQTLGAASGARAKHRRVGFLTAAPTASVVTALLARRVVSSLLFFGTGVLAAAVAFALGAGSPASAVAFGLGVLWLLVAVSVVVLPVGLLVNWVVAGYGLSSTARAGLGAAWLGVMYAALFGRRLVAAALAGTPVAWVGDFLLATTPGAAVSPARGAAFALASVAVTLVAAAVCFRLADLTWYSDPALGEVDGDAGDGDPTRLGASLGAVLSPRTAALVAVTWRRTWRTPRTLFYVYPSAFVGVVMAEQLVFHGPFSAALYPAIAAFAGATAAGSGFTLNPLGTEGDALPALLSSGAGSSRVVRAKALAAALPAGPLVVGIAVGTGVGLAGLPPAVLAGAVAYALALLALATLCSQALGVHYPPDHEELLGGSVKVPNKSASAVYSVCLVAVAIPGFAGFVRYADAGALDAVFVAGVGLSVVVACALAALSYRHATSRLRGYSVE